jgi:hypothetical protein
MWAKPSLRLGSLSLLASITSQAQRALPPCCRLIWQSRKISPPHAHDLEQSQSSISIVSRPTACCVLPVHLPVFASTRIAFVRPPERGHSELPSRTLPSPPTTALVTAHRPVHDQIDLLPGLRHLDPPSATAMGTNGGSGLGETGGMMGNNGNQPPTTEYTLQG